MRCRPATVAVLMLAGSALQGADRIGELAWVEGEVTLVRAGSPLAAGSVEIGTHIENFDSVQTGADGAVDASIGSATSPTASIHVAPGTEFSFEVSKLAARHQTSISLVAGSVAVKAAKLVAGQDLKVHTDATVMSVRGTSFVVTVADSGDLLVTCDEGEVTCAAEDGTELWAVPGEAIEARVGERPRALAVAAGDLERFRGQWLEERLASFRAAALPQAIALARSYELLAAQLEADLAVLRRAQRVIDKWEAEDRQGRIGGRLEVAREKREVIGALLRLRRTTFRLERVVARLAALSRLHAAGLLPGAIRPGLTTAQFFDRLRDQRQDVAGKIAAVRNVARLFAARADGRVPIGSFDDAGDESSFLGN